MELQSQTTVGSLHLLNLLEELTRNVKELPSACLRNFARDFTLLTIAWLVLRGDLSPQDAKERALELLSPEQNQKTTRSIPDG